MRAYISFIVLWLTLDESIFAFDEKLQIMLGLNYTYCIHASIAFEFSDICFNFFVSKK